MHRVCSVCVPCSLGGVRHAQMLKSERKSETEKREGNERKRERERERERERAMRMPML